MAKKKSNLEPLLPQPADFRRVKEVEFLFCGGSLKRSPSYDKKILEGELRSPRALSR
jgi:hypothetical protein